MIGGRFWRCRGGVNRDFFRKSIRIKSDSSRRGGKKLFDSDGVESRIVVLTLHASSLSRRKPSGRRRSVGPSLITPSRLDPLATSRETP